MKIKILPSVIFICFVMPVYGQKCDCPAYYDWLKKAFEQNDAGFTHTLENKGDELYEVHNRFFLGKVAKAEYLEECVDILRDWLAFFRKFHIGLITVAQEAGEASESGKFAYPSRTQNEINTLARDMKGKPPDIVEGIWKTYPYTIVVVKEEEDYKGYILHSANESWKSGEVKFSLGHHLDKGVFLMGDHSVKHIRKVSFSDSKYLVLDEIVLEKEIPHIDLDPAKEFYYKTEFAEYPFIERINEKTIFIKLPSFGLEQKSAIDSLLLQWREEILKSEHLIIDIRNNNGGADKTYSKLLPFIYTHPIHRNQIEFYSSDENNRKWNDVLAIPDLPENERLLISDFVTRLNDNPGGFERIFKDDITVIELDTVYPRPGNVAVIFNENTASAAEQFVLDMKQSWKVKTFGQQTAGALDVANVSTLMSPDGKIMLVYGTSRYISIHQMTIDDVGILPDFYITDGVKKDEWISFVLERMK